MLQPHRVQITKEETREKVRTFFYNDRKKNNHRSIKRSIVAMFLFRAFSFRKEYTPRDGVSI